MLTRSAARKETDAQVNNTDLRQEVFDSDGTRIIITPSATGEGVHTRWVNYPPPICALPSTSSLFSAASTASLTPSSSVATIDPRFVTPTPQHSFHAGAVLRTPRKLLRSPDRIGGHGIPIWERNHPDIPERLMFIEEDGPTVRELLERERFERESEIVEEQLAKLKAARKGEVNLWLEAEGKGGGESSKTPLGALFGVATKRLGPSGTVLVDGNGNSMLGSPFQSQQVVGSTNASTLRVGPHGQRLGPHGTHLLGPHGTHLLESGSTGILTISASEVNNAMETDNNSTIVGPQGQRLGPYGTHLLGPQGTHLFGSGNAETFTESTSEVDDTMDYNLSLSQVGPQGQRLGRHGTHLLGPEGTELFVDLGPIYDRIVDERIHALGLAPRRGAALGPHGTELIQ